ncbi:predicted protein [Pyrenophora tritici-repentis Pt-1C-BFP]|uniref:Uncharacterized protein n=1 Tax=Pyrenophora tritici-repentis (strain Pt-1C-BFP) TaxID=426418 RepID=B2VTR6_PYRTR|nr:uncharacterized protein PTRG_00911 [Pyrenophora tritici-repentis Pt-1C-BFP]EDU40349.1 predicted protein [Pyrenophora tritici-repentis Pt-1C-BFP]
MPLAAGRCAVGVGTRATSTIVMVKGTEVCMAAVLGPHPVAHRVWAKGGLTCKDPQHEGQVSEGPWLPLLLAQCVLSTGS